MADSYDRGVYTFWDYMLKHISLQIVISDAGHLESICCGVPVS